MAADKSMAENKKDGGVVIPSIWLTILGWVGPSLVGLVISYGAYMAASAKLEDRISTQETKVVELQNQLNYYRDNYISVREFKPTLDGLLKGQEDMNHRLGDIQNDFKTILLNRNNR